MIVSRLSADCRIVCAMSLLIDRERRVEEHRRQADDAVHRRPDLVADGREKRALRPGRVEREIARPLELARLRREHARLRGDAIARGLDLVQVGGGLRLRALPLGEIARDDEEAGDVAVGDAQAR